MSPSLEHRFGSGEPYVDECRAKKVIMEMNKDRCSGKYCDVKLEVEGKEYPAHKAVLSNLSPYFEALFSGGYAESNQPSIKLQTIHSCAIEVILDCAYADQIIITEENVEAVIHAAHLLQVPKVFEACSSFLASNMNSGNCIGILKIAKLYMNKLLKDRAREYWIRHFRQVWQEEEFLAVNAGELIKVISNERLFVDNEDQVFEAVCRWVSFREAERTCFLNKVLKHVRLMYVSWNLLKERVKSVRAFRKSKVFMSFMKVAVRYHNMMPQLGPKLSTSMTKRRPAWPVEVVKMFVEHNFIGESQKTHHVIREVSFNENGEVLKEKRVFEMCFTNLVSVYDSYIPESSSNKYTSQRVLSCGDTIAGVVNNSPHVYGRDSCKWKVSFHNKEEDSGVTFVDGDYYIIGGRLTNNSMSNKVSRRNISAQEEVTLAPLPFPVSQPVVVTLNKKIYVFGGKVLRQQYNYFRCETVTNRVQRYDIATNTWEQLTPLPVVRSVLGACVLKDRIFVYVRNNPARLKYSKRQQVHMFNPTKNAWETCGNLSYVFISGPAVLKDKMYVLTERRPRLRPCIERYSPETDSWQIFADVPGFWPISIVGPLPIRCVRKPKRSCDSGDGEVAMKTNKPAKLRLF